MRKLLNTLYILTPESYLSLDGENVVIQQGDKEMGRFPLHTLEMILSFSYRGASPALMGGCAKRGVGLCFFTPNGRFLARATGEERGNVLLRKAQYRLSDELPHCQEFYPGENLQQSLEPGAGHQGPPHAGGCSRPQGCLFLPGRAL